MKKSTLLSTLLALGLAFSISGCGGASHPEPTKATEGGHEKAHKTHEHKASVIPASAVDFEKQGFLTIDTCAKEGAFTDCRLENYACGSDGCYKKTDPGIQEDVNVVLYSHKDGITYNLDISRIHPHEIDEGINRNDVTIIGKYDAATNTIYAIEFKAPPPPKKSFFKGCL